MTPPYRGFQDFYRRGPYACHLTEHRLAGSNTVRLLQVEQPAGDFPDPPLPDYVVYVAQRGARELSFDWGCGRWRGAWRADDVSIAPPDTATDIHVDTPHAFLALALPKALVGAALEDLAPRSGEDLGALHTATFRNAFVASACRRLWQHGDAGSCALQNDSLILSTLEMLVRELGPSQDAAEPSGLDRRRLHRVADYVEANLARNITLAELAAVGGLSSMHFARQFKTAVGTSPCQFVLDRRLRRAERLLVTTAHRLIDIAEATGFSSQAHMTATFTRRRGTPPAKIRACRQT